MPLLESLVMNSVASTLHSDGSHTHPPPQVESDQFLTLPTQQTQQTTQILLCLLLADSVHSSAKMIQTALCLITLSRSSHPSLHAADRRPASTWTVTRKFSLQCQFVCWLPKMVIPTWLQTEQFVHITANLPKRLLSAQKTHSADHWAQITLVVSSPKPRLASNSQTSAFSSLPDNFSLITPYILLHALPWKFNLPKRRRQRRLFRNLRNDLKFFKVFETRQTSKPSLWIKYEGIYQVKSMWALFILVEFFVFS